MKNIYFFAWRSLPCIRARIVPLRRFRFGRRVRANRNVFTTLGMFIQDVNFYGQVGIRHTGVRANEALNPVAEHDSMHVRGFNTTAIVIKRDCGLWHELMDLFIYLFITSLF
jgi:hypothetical protein